MLNKGLSAFAVLVVVAVAATGLNVAGQERFVRPVDGAAKDASFVAFRTKLIAAAERRDVNYIISILDPKVRLSFGGDEGVADFKKFWNIGQKDSLFWGEFLAVIKNGGSFSGEGRNKLSLFTAPYTFSDWPDDIDGFEYHVIFGNRVNLRERPSMDARVVGQLSYNVVKIDGEKSVMLPDDRGFDWVRVETLGGKKGFVKGDFVRSHIDYRAGFEKKGGVWKMTFFLAGD